MKPVEPLTPWERTCLAEGYGTTETLALLAAREAALRAADDVLRARQALALVEADAGAEPLPPHVAVAVRLQVDRHDNEGMRHLRGEELRRADLAVRVHEHRHALDLAERDFAEALATLPSTGGGR